MIVADTDVLIDALGGHEPALGQVDRELARGRLASTTITAFELLSGARTDSERERVSTLLDALALLPLDTPASQSASAVRTELESRGQGIGMADYLIAGICLSRGLPLLTRNRGHFQRVTGLELVDLAG